MISVKEAADILNLSTKTVYQWIAQGLIASQRLGNQYYLERDTVLAKLAELGRQSAAPTVKHDPLISDMLRCGGIYYGVEAEDMRTALHNALSRIKAIDAKAMEPIYQMFLSREELCSTGIGNGMAIPHSRSPLVGHASQPLLSLSYLAKPVDFGAPDGMPVSILFMLISPNMQTHLRILAKLSFLLQDPLCRKTVLSQATPEIILANITEAEQRCGN